MAGQVSQSESDIYYRRLVNAVKAMQDTYEEVKRLQSEKVTLNLATNLDEHSSGGGGPGIVTKVQAISLFGVLTDFESFYENATVPFDTTDGGTERRAKIDPFLAIEPLI